MICLEESEINEDPQRLRECWLSRRSFFIVPRKRGFSDEWLNKTLAVVSRNYENGCFGLFTSGSTGLPRLVLASKERARRMAEVLHLVQQGNDVHEVVFTLPISYCFAFVNQWLWAHQYETRMVWTGGVSYPERIIGALKKADGAMLCLVGAQLPFLKSIAGRYKYEGVSCINFAGGRFPQDGLGIVKEIFPRATIYNNYGCTEAMPRLTIRRAEDSDDWQNIGKPLPGVELRNNSDDSLEFRSPYSALGLIGEAICTKFTKDQWMPTGDKGQELPDGTWKILGRTDEIFKRYGEKISLPAILDFVLDSWSGQVTSYKETDPNLEEGYILVLSPSPTKPQLRQVLASFRKNFTRTHWPLRIESVSNFTYLSSGKIDEDETKNASQSSVHWRLRL